MSGKLTIHGFKNKKPDAATIIVNSQAVARVRSQETVIINLKGDSTISCKYGFLTAKEAIQVKDGENLEIQLNMITGAFANKITIDVVNGDYTTTDEKQKIAKFIPMPGCVYALDGGVGDYLHVFEDRVVIQHKGTLNFLAMGLKGDKTLFYSNITSVQYKKPGITSGYIQFSIPGGTENTGGVFAASSDENTITIAGSNVVAAADEIVDYINKKILEHKSGQNSTVVQPLSCADEIKKLKELLDLGIITEEEFTKKKKEMLGL